MNIADRYLQSISKLQEAPCCEQLAITSIVIASKFSETNAIFMQTVRSCNDARVNKDIVVQLELEVLNRLDFDIYQPTILDFFAKYQKLFKSDRLSQPL